jgi:hypothetical protein
MMCHFHIQRMLKDLQCKFREHVFGNLQKIIAYTNAELTNTGEQLQSFDWVRKFTGMMQTFRQRGF